MNRARAIATIAVLLVSGAIARGQAVPSNIGVNSTTMPAQLQNVGFDPQLNAQIPLDLPFVDENGSNVQLRDYFKQKPVVLAFVYYGCPMLCNQVEQGVVGSLRMLSFTPGRDYEVVFVSFDPRESPDMAAQKKKSALAHFRRPETASGWHFLTGTKESIDAATKAANFRYSFDTKTNLFAHASGIMLLTPDGRISRYFYGVEYPGRDMRLGLVDASAGKIGTPIDRVLLFCYQYDPSSATYSACYFENHPAGRNTHGTLHRRRHSDFSRRDATQAGMKRAQPRRHFKRTRSTLSVQAQFPLIPEQASNFAPAVDLLMLFIVAICLFFAVAITAAVIYFFFKYERKHQTEIGVPIHGDMRLETAWIVVPLVLAMAMFAWGAVVYVDFRHSPGDTLDIYVVGKQWMWKVQQPNGLKEINEVHLPVRSRRPADNG